MITGGHGFDTILGGAGIDRITGGEDDDMLDGGSGADTFVFNLNDGNDSIDNFENGIDKIEITIAGLTYADIEVTRTAEGTLLAYSTADTIHLKGFDIGLVSEDDFTFV